MVAGVYTWTIELLADVLFRLARREEPGSLATEGFSEYVVHACVLIRRWSELWQVARSWVSCASTGPTSSSLRFKRLRVVVLH